MSAKRTILIVDDEVNFVRLLEVQLRKLGYRALTAHNGVEALKVLETDKPDIITLDVNMPKMDGLEFYKRILTKHGRPRYPVLMLTAREDLKETFEAIEADGFMGKPFEINHFVAEVEQILNQKREASVLLFDSREKEQCLEIAKALEAERYEVTIVSSLEELKKFCKEKTVDFVALEYVQKEIDGAELIKMVNALYAPAPERSDKKMPESEEFIPELSSVPIVVYSYSSHQYREESLEASAVKYIGKPNSPDDVVIAVRALEIERKKKN